MRVLMIDVPSHRQRGVERRLRSTGRLLVHGRRDSLGQRTFVRVNRSKDLGTARIIPPALTGTASVDGILKIEPYDLGPEPI